MLASAQLVIFTVVGASSAPPLDAVYHCEACRAVLEEVEFHLERELFTKRSKGEAVEELNPRDILDWVCKFEKDQPKIYTQRWSAYSEPYRAFCADFMADEPKRAALIEVLNGDRSLSPAARQKAAVARATTLCARKLKLCAEPPTITTSCAACEAVARDLDAMLTRIPGAEAKLDQLTVEENLSSQCEALPWRFGFASKREENLVTDTCHEFIGEHDDALVHAATKHTGKARRVALVKACEEEYCDGSGTSTKDEL